MSRAEGLGVFPSGHPRHSSPWCVPHSVIFTFPRCFDKCPCVFEWYCSPSCSSSPTSNVSHKPRVFQSVSQPLHP